MIIYDNISAINIERLADIPCDYYGLMGVPITFLGKYEPKQFDGFDYETPNEKILFGLSYGQSRIKQSKKQMTNKRV